jgi:DNA-binding protein YbaB
LRPLRIDAVPYDFRMEDRRRTELGAGVSSGGGVLDPDGAMERLTAWKEKIDKLAADTKSMSDRLQQLRITASDGNGITEVTIDASGALVDLRLGQRIQHVSPTVVADTIMKTIRKARQELANRSQDIIAETVGTESVAARAIADRVARQLRGSESDNPDNDQPRRW